jgi:hypothetical protein
MTMAAASEAEKIMFCPRLSMDRLCWVLMPAACRQHAVRALLAVR